MKSKTLAAVLGIALVAIGIGYIGNIFEVWDFRIFFPGWWTLLILIPAVVKIVKNGAKPIYIIWLAAGALLLITQSGLLPDIVGRLTMPILIGALGFAILFRSRLGSGDGYIAIFSGRAPDFTKKPFTGAFAVAIFGGVTIKLREAVIDADTTIDAIAAFGGVDVLVPPNVNVEVSGIPLFGGLGEPKNRVHIEGAPTLRVNAIAIFGGVDVK